MNDVPRGTAPPKVSPILFRAPMREANHADTKDTTRRIVSAANSSLRYGQFSGLDLESARAVRALTGVHLATPCTYPRHQFRAGVTAESQRRIVEVRSKVKAGDLFWEKVGRFGSRAASGWTYDVLAVDVGRVQDMTAFEALREGVAHVQLPRRLALHAPDPRAVFAWLWDSINGAGSWASNPWVWIYRYRSIPQNVDAFLASKEGRRD